MSSKLWLKDRPWGGIIQTLLAFLLFLSWPHSLPELPHLLRVHSSRSELCLSWVEHRERSEDIKSLTSSPWAMQGSQLWYEVKEITGKKGQEGIPVAMDSPLGSALKPLTTGPIILEKCVLPSWQAYNGFNCRQTQRKGSWRSMGGGSCSLGSVTCNTIKARRCESPNTELFSVPFLKMVSLPLSDYIQNPALFYYWLPFFGHLLYRWYVIELQKWRQD